MKQSKEHVRINRLPMSAQQKNIWEMMKKYEGTCLGNIGGFLELQGDIEKEKIRQVLQKIQYLNAALRLCVDETGNLYLQDSSDVDFCIVDCRKFTDFQTKEYIQKEMNTSLFKSNQVLVRYKLFQQREKSYLLGIYHHLICDGLSLQKIIRDIFEMIHDSKSPLWGKNVVPDLQFIEDLKMENFLHLDRNTTYFRQLTESFRNPAMKFADRRAGESGVAAVYQKKILGHDYTILKNQCVQHRLTVEQLYEAALACYFANITASEKVSLGRVMMNRGKKRMETVGMYANTLPMAICVKAGDTYLDLCKEIQRMEFEMLKYSGISIQSFREKEDISGKLYDVSVSYRPFSRLPGNRKEDIREIDCNMLEIPLKVVIDEYHDKFILTYKYRTGVYTKEEICAMDESLEKIIRAGLQGAKNRDIQFHNGKAAYISSREQELLKKQKESSLCKTDSPDIIDQFFQYAYVKPSSTLWIDLSGVQKKRITYKEAAAYVMFLSKKLRRELEAVRNFGQEKRQPVVGLLLKRTYRLPLMMLTALNIGAIFYLINIDESSRRLRAIREQVTIMVNDAQVDEWLREQSETNSDEENIHITDIKWQIEDLAAYRINTSGSTGTPKLAQISRSALNLRLHWMVHTFHMKECRVLQKTKNTFDVSIWELLLPSMCGGSLVLIPEGQERDPQRIVDVVQEYGVTVLHFVPSMLSAFLFWTEKRERAQGIRNCLVDVMVSGEQLSSSLVQRWMDQFPEVRLHNLYGPAECTIDVSWHDCIRGETVTPIGYPVWNTELIIVNENKKEIPFGYIGEILILGDLVGQGYMDNPEENNKRFISFGKEKGYLTGDLGYVTDDGEILYVGRKDREIKHRGMRINLAVLEKEVAAAPDVRNAAAIMQDGHLILFLETRQSREKMRELLSELLAPHYMPDMICPVENLPCTPNGKCDYRELFQMWKNQTGETKKERNVHGKTKRSSALSELERILLTCVNKVSGVNIASVDVDILQYGMDSLRVVELMLELEKHGFAIRYDEIYQAGTIRKIAERLKRTGKEQKVKNYILRQYPAWIQMTNKEDFFKVQMRKIVIGIPYAGTSVHVFDSLAEEFKKRSFLFLACDVEKELGSVKKIAEKIEGELLPLMNGGQTELIIIGCCVGSALALELAGRMQHYPQIKVKLALMGSLPSRSFQAGSKKILLWDILPRKAGESVLSFIYGKNVRITQTIYDRLKKEAGKYVDYFDSREKTVGKLKTSMYRVNVDTIFFFGTRDPLTVGYRQRYRQWKKYIKGHIKIVEIKKARHFFIGTYAKEIVDRILKECHRNF